MMEPVTPYFGLEVCFKGAVADEINTFRQMYDPTYLEIGPHISLAYPPFVAYNLWKKIRPEAVDCLAVFKPFTVIFKEVGLFMSASPSEPNILWLKPEDGGILTSMRLALEKRFPEYIPPIADGYIPHLSIGFIQGLAAVQAAREQVQSQITPIEAIITEITYEAQDDSQGLHVFDALPLIG